MPRRLTLIFDGAWGFWTRSARLVEALDRDHRVTVVPYQKSGVPASAGLSVEQCESAAWAAEPGDAPGQPRHRWRGAGAINASLAVALGLKLPLSFYGLPGVRWVQERAYDLVAANRCRLPGDEPYCEQYPDNCRWGRTVLVRWYEEPTLARRFGADYEAYRRAVPTWWPRLRRLKPSERDEPARNSDSLCV